MNLLDVFAADGELLNENRVDPNANPNAASAQQQPLQVPGLIPPPQNISAIEHVRLPGFWRHSPQQWFKHAEAVFHSNRIRSDLTKMNHVLTALDEDGIRTVSDLLGPNAQYSAVRDRLISAYAVPQATRFRTIVQHGGMGDRRPSQMLRDMRSVLPEGIGDAALKEFWMQKLPLTILTVISGLDGPLDTLAERADRVMDASAGREISAVSSSNTLERRFQTMESAITALTVQIAALVTSQPKQDQQSWQRSSTRSRSRNRSQSRQRNKDFCYYHNRFGKEAKNCRDPCSFRSEN